MIKEILLCLIGLLLVAFHSLGQSEDTLSCRIFDVDSISNKAIYQTMKLEPTPIIGQEGLYYLFVKNIIYDKSLLKELGVGNLKAIITIYIDENGEVFSSRIDQEVEGTNVAEQMIEIVKSLKWNPGMCDNVVVSSVLKIPLQISLR